MEEEDRVLELAQQLADPTRLRILRHLAAEGPTPATQLAVAASASPSRTSNHLKRLQDTGLVTAARAGKQRLYRLASPHIGEFLATLRAAAADEKPSAPERPPAPLAVARSCYDHLAGVAGVTLLDGLVARGALLPATRVRADIALGAAAEPVFAELGVDVSKTSSSKRRFAFACLDWTERRPHLGGALGAALLDRFLALGWFVRRRDSRALGMTPAGLKGFENVLGADADRLRRYAEAASKT